VSILSAKPTVAELSILRVLWANGPSTVRDVYESVYQGTNVGYTSALKLLQNMHAKGLVTRNEESKQHLYTAAVQQRRTLNGVVRQWIDGSFGGSSAELAMQALEAKPVTVGELNKLKAMIQRLEERGVKP
jgi:BlaI family penicillinase repressor